MDTWLKNPLPPRRQRGTWTFAPVTLALAALVALGCVAPTPVEKEPTIPPSFLESMEEFELSYQVGRRIDRLLLPPATAGSGALTYSLTPEIPGLIFDAHLRILSGTPTEVGEYDMTYRATDTDDNTATLRFTITVETATVVRTIVSAVAGGQLRFMEVPQQDGGPAVAVAGNPVVTAGGSFFLDVATGRAADKLLLSIGGEPFGYYEVDLESAASPHRLTGQLPFDLDPAVGPFCLQVTAVDGAGAAGRPAGRPARRCASPRWAAARCRSRSRGIPTPTSICTCWTRTAMRSTSARMR